MPRGRDSSHLKENAEKETGNAKRLPLSERYLQAFFLFPDEKGGFQMYYSQAQIDHANAVSLEDFLRSQGESLKRCGKDMEWKAHDSLKVRGNKWHRFSNDTGSYPIDFVMEFYGNSFPEAVEMLIGEKGEGQLAAVPAPSPEFRLPMRNVTNANARNYLVTKRKIDEVLIDRFLNAGDVYEDAKYHNVVFIGRDLKNMPRYAHCRGTNDKFRLDVSGSDKSYGFSYQGKNDQLCVFEAPIDLLSFINLFLKNWDERSYLSLGGVAYKALQQFIEDHKGISTIYLCLDNDEAGEAACIHLNKEIPEDMKVLRMKPPVKDWNELLIQREQIDRKDWFVLSDLRERTDAGEFVPMIA